MSRVPVGRLGEWHDPNWNRKWWKKMCLGLDILHTRHLWNGHRELHSKPWSRRSKAGQELLALGAAISRTRSHGRKAHSAALRLILLHSPLRGMCIQQRELARPNTREIGSGNCTFSLQEICTRITNKTKLLSCAAESNTSFGMMCFD